MLKDFILVPLLDGHMQVIKSWMISSSLLELESFILALSLNMLEDFILVLLLNGHVQVLESWKILSLFFELEDFILILSMNVLEDLIFVLLLEATSRERRDGRVKLFYN